MRWPWSYEKFYSEKVITMICGMIKNVERDGKKNRMKVSCKLLRFIFRRILVK